MAMFIVKPWYRKSQEKHIYGTAWNGLSNNVWLRTDDAVGLTDPNPYYAGMSSSPSSPFDDLMPWKGIREVDDSVAGKLIEFPKFWYKYTFDSSNKITGAQIATYPASGFLVSPAHADRGDGNGERDFVYVGKYTCDASYKSVTNSTSVSDSIANARNRIHNLGANIWQYDFAMYWTLNLLFIVEYSSWNCHTTIGYGRGGTGTKVITGNTDSIPYHTGTTATSRASYGFTKYRYIEGLYSNGVVWVDGCYLSNSNVYITNNPANFGESSANKILVTQNRTAGSSWWYQTINGFTNSIASDDAYKYAMFPVNTSGHITTGSSEYYNSYNDSVCAQGLWIPEETIKGGIFSLHTSPISVNQYCRLMVLPPSRLSA